MSDFEFLSVCFQFEETEHYSLIRKKNKPGHIEFCITIMNGKLEKLLYGNHIIKQVDGRLQIDDIIPSDKQSQLKLAVAKALKKLLDNSGISHHDEKELADVDH